MLCLMCLGAKCVKKVDQNTSGFRVIQFSPKRQKKEVQRATLYKMQISPRQHHARNKKKEGRYVLHRLLLLPPSWNCSSPYAHSIWWAIFCFAHAVTTRRGLSFHGLHNNEFYLIVCEVQIKMLHERG